MIDPQHMKSLIISVALLMSFGLAVRAQEEPASPAAEEKSYPEVPKEYEIGESTVSPDKRFAILYEVRDEDSNVDPGLPNLLVRLKPYAVLKEIENDDGVTWKGAAAQRTQNGTATIEWLCGITGNGATKIWLSIKSRTTKSYAKTRSGRRW